MKARSHRLTCITKINSIYIIHNFILENNFTNPTVSVGCTNVFERVGRLSARFEKVKRKLRQFIISIKYVHIAKNTVWIRLSSTTANSSS